MARLVSWWRRAGFEEELDEEIRFHLEMETEQNISRGMDPEEARRAARRSFGGVCQIKDELRSLRGLDWLESMLQDARYALRTFAQRPGYALLVVLTLALGIGANTAIFSVTYAVLLRPLPYTDGERLLMLRQAAPGADVPDVPFSALEIADVRALNRTLEAVVEYHGMPFILLGEGEPERVQTGVVSADFFEVLKVEPYLGRTFLPGEDALGAEPVLLLSYDYWLRSHGGDPNIIGREFEMNDRPHRVVGILPPLPQFPDENDVYMATFACPFRSSENSRTNRESRMLSAFAKLREGATLEEAREDLARIADELETTFPEVYPAAAEYGITASALTEELTQRARPTLLLLLATSGFVLLIVCANVANITLSRLLRRERELTVRAAIGAGGFRLLRQLLTESALLALAGGALGLGFAWLGLDLLVRFASRVTPRASETGIDATVLLFTLGLSLVTALVFGCLPALTSGRRAVGKLNEASFQASQSRRSLRLRALLAVSQVAVSLTLLVGAGLMMRSLLHLQRVDAGFDPERVLSLMLDLNWSKYDTAEAVRRFHQELLERVDSIESVRAAAIARTAPLVPLAAPVTQSIQIEGRENEEGDSYFPSIVDFHSVSPEYFRTIGMSLERGRFFRDEDGPTASRVVIINASAAEKLWDETDPMGKRLSTNGGKTWARVVGIVGNVRQYGLAREADAAIYLPAAQAPLRVSNLLVRTAANPRTMARSIIEAVYQVDPDQPVAEVQTLEEARSESIAAPRLTTTLLILFAASALMITAAGLSGVLGLSVAQRTHEIGIRMAVGATPRRLRQMVVAQGMTLVVAGLGAGTILALALSQLLRGLLFEVRPHDPVTFGIVLLVLVVVAGIACWIPARRATSVDPLQALKSP